MSLHAPHEFRTSDNPSYQKNCLKCGRVPGWYWHVEPEPAPLPTIAPEERIKELEKALDDCQGEAYLGTLEGDDTPTAHQSCVSVIDICLGALTKGGVE